MRMRFTRSRWIPGATGGSFGGVSSAGKDKTPRQNWSRTRSVPWRRRCRIAISGQGGLEVFLSYHVSIRKNPSGLSPSEPAEGDLCRGFLYHDGGDEGPP